MFDGKPGSAPVRGPAPYEGFRKGWKTVVISGGIWTDPEEVITGEERSG